MQPRYLFFPDQFAIVSRSCAGGSSLHEGLVNHFLLCPLAAPSLRSVSGGRIMRSWAAERNMKIGEFAAHNEAHPEEGNDYKMDQWINGWAMQRGGVFDGRCPLRYAAPGAFQILLTCDVGIRAQRRASQDNRAGEIDMVREELIKRDGADDRRYVRLYGEQVLDESEFDLTIDTGVYGKEDTLAMTLDAHAAWLERKRREGRIANELYVPEFHVEMRRIKSASAFQGLAA